MTEQMDIDKAVRELADDVLATRRSALSAAGLRATMEVKRWFTDGRENCELRMGFWRENKVIDGLEDHIVREGTQVNSLDEFRVEGKCSYTAYGTPTCEGTATTLLGWDGQYTSSDTGLIYLRAREHDPSTAQFLSVDPLVAATHEPYVYAGDNPVNRRDPDGLSAGGLEGVPCYFPFCGPPPPAVEGVQHGLEKVEHGIESVWNAINENEGPNDEGEVELSKRETERILDEAGTDAHTDKGETVGEGEAGHYDYYRDKSTGEIYLVPKSGGEPIPTGLGG